MPDLVVVDTGVLQKANAPVGKEVRERSKFARRRKLLSQVKRGLLRVLVSEKLLAEYRRQVPKPRNDFVRAFFELLTRPGGAVWNWCRWSGKIRSHASFCRFPREDYHVLRTAICPSGSTILSEEHRMLVTDACIHQRLGVHVIDPTV
jgi:hypothetical protein